MRNASCVAALTIVALGGVACSSNSTTSTRSVASTTTTATAKATSTTTAAKSSTYTVGQSAKTGGMDVTVYAFKNPYPPTNDAFNAPAGQQYVTVDVQVTNPDSKSQPFSSLIGFHLLDSANRQYDETIVPGLSPSAPDGQIGPGQSIRGYAAFEVPAGTSGLRFRTQGSLTATGAVWTLT